MTSSERIEQARVYEGRSPNPKGTKITVSWEAMRDQIEEAIAQERERIVLMVDRARHELAATSGYEVCGELVRRIRGTSERP